MRILPLAVLVLAAVPTLAQPAPENVKLASAIVDITSPVAAGNAQIEAQLKAMREGAAVRAMLSQNPQLRLELAKNTPAANGGIVRLGLAQAEAMGPILREMQTTGRQATIESYARNFTAPELQAILGFYRSPAGAKLVRQQGAMARDVGAQVQAKFGPRVQAAEKMLGEKLRAEMPKMFPELAAKAN